MATRRVLIVDDNEVELLVARRALERAGFAVSTLTSTLRINTVIGEDRPDVIVLDVNMPALRGDKAAAILKRYRHTRDIPVLLHSALEEDDLAQLVAATGACGFLKKSGNSSHLVTAVWKATLAAATQPVAAGLATQ